MCTVRFRSLCCCCSCLFCTLYIMCLLKLINLHITPTAYHNKRLNRQNVWIGCTLTLRGMPAKRSSFYLQRWGQKRDIFHSFITNESSTSKKYRKKDCILLEPCFFLLNHNLATKKNWAGPPRNKNESMVKACKPWFCFSLSEWKDLTKSPLFE